MTLGYQKDRCWADKYLSQVIKILRQHAVDLMKVNIAPRADDEQRATDVILKLFGGDVAVRLRRPGCRFRDLTIRSCRDSGYATELQKIRAGFADFYFYGWLDYNDRISEWILVDLDRVRQQRVLDDCQNIPNGDGTYFIAIDARELQRRDCIIASTLMKQ